MNEWQVILCIGAEGGSLVLQGRQVNTEWVYRLQLNDQTPMLLDEASITRDSDAVTSWSDALRLLDRYPWTQLYPVEVNARFREQVKEAVLSRWQSDQDAHTLARWDALLTESKS